MKTRRPLRIAIAAALMIGGAYAAPVVDALPQRTRVENSASAPAERQSDAQNNAPARNAKTAKKPSGKAKANGKIPTLNALPRHAKAANTNRSKQVSNNRAPLLSSHPNSAGTNKSVAGKVTKSALSSTTVIRDELPSSPASLDNARHRGPSPAVIDGRNFRAGSTGGISGNRISRKP